MKRKIGMGLLIFLLTLLIASYSYIIKHQKNDWLIGGQIILSNNAVCALGNNNYNEEYHRPSQKNSLDNQYNLQLFINNNVKINNPIDIVYAYYGLLEEASNINEQIAGCGLIGNGQEPYSYAYSLLSNNYKSNKSLKDFKNSFKGIGHISFLTIYPILSMIDAHYYFIEIEVISVPTDKKVKNYQDEISYFSYYYGIVTVISEEKQWKIDDINYYSEEFLCAPYHNWFYDAKAVVDIVYKDNLNIVDKIVDVNIVNDLTYIYGEKNNRKYRFDFVKITNGHDILIGENIMINGMYTPSNLLSSEWQYLKLSIPKEK